MNRRETPLSLLNVFEVESEGVCRRLICFLDPIAAGTRGIDARAVVGECRPVPGADFDLEAFELEPAFVVAFTGYMNEVASRAEEVAREAKDHPGDWLYIVDPRHRDDAGGEPPPSELMGCFAVDGSGQIVPNSFMYNQNHRWFDPVSGVSGVLEDRRFYDWLHSGSNAK